MSEISPALEEWALQEMCFQSPGSAEELSTICSGPMGEVWRWIIGHARRRENVRKIKGNIALTTAVTTSLSMSSSHSVTNSSFFDSERKMLMEERSRLMGDLHTALMRMQRLKCSLDSSKADLTKLDNKNAESNVQVQIGQHRVSLLNLYARKTNNLLSKLSTISARLKELLQEESCGKQEMFFSGNDGLVSEEDMKLENSIVQCSALFKDILLGNLVSGKTSVKSLVLKEMSSVQPQFLVKALVKHSSKLEREVSAKLRDNLQDGNLVDADEEETVLETVSKEILDFSRRQISSFKSMSTVENNVSNLRETFDDVKMKSQHAQTEDVQFFAENEALRKSLEHLELQGQNNPILEDDLADQQNAIDGLCQVISSLILKSSTKALKVHQLKTLEIMTSAVPTLSEKISSLAPALKDVPSLNLKALNSAPTWKLTSAKVVSEDWMTLTPTCNLVIYRNLNKMPRQPSIVFSSKSDSVGQVVESLRSLSTLKKNLEEENKHNAEASTLKKLQNLELTLSTNIKEQSRNLMPVIDECKERQKKIRGLLTTFKESHNDWKIQPAKSVALSDSCDWGEVEGRTLQQSLDLTKFYLNKLNN